MFQDIKRELGETNVLATQKWLSMKMIEGQIQAYRLVTNGQSTNYSLEYLLSKKKLRMRQTLDNRLPTVQAGAAQLPHQFKQNAKKTPCAFCRLLHRFVKKNKSIRQAIAKHGETPSNFQTSSSQQKTPKQNICILSVQHTGHVSPSK